MLMTSIVIAVTSASLVLGAMWGLFGRLPRRVEGFLIAMAGGALIVSVMSELVTPAGETLHPFWLTVMVGLGAGLFVWLDTAVERKVGEDSGAGLLLAITVDGIPENLALGVALIGAGPMEVMALAGSIFLSNLPEAAGGARDMREDGMSRKRSLTLWIGTAGLLSLAALIGNVALANVGDSWLAMIRAFAGGAVVASLATEVFPKAYREEHHGTGIAVALGLIIAHLLGLMGGGGG
ncbi:zinc transporter [Roseovarius sp. 22II1-1F6A]|nr:zinc transporter [Roseovarius sp. 22II1-1F6A]